MSSAVPYKHIITQWFNKRLRGLVFFISWCGFPVSGALNKAQWAELTCLHASTSTGTWDIDHAQTHNWLTHTETQWYPPLLSLSFPLFAPLHPSLLFFSPLLPSPLVSDIVMLLHTTLSRLRRWSHEWSLQFKSTQPSHPQKWIFCIYSCNNDSIWGYYLQTVPEFSTALITKLWPISQK